MQPNVQRAAIMAAVRNGQTLALEKGLINYFSIFDFFAFESTLQTASKLVGLE
jgi:hypothetical protein